MNAGKSGFIRWDGGMGWIEYGWGMEAWGDIKV